MADKKVQNKDLFAGDLFEKTAKDVEGLIKELDKLEEKIVDVAKVQKKVLNTEDNLTLQSVTKTNKAVATLNKTEAVTLEIQKQKIKLDNKLKTARTDQIQDNEQLKVLVSEQNKINKQLARESLGLVGAYEQQSKRLIKLRKDLKNVAVEKGIDAKETRNLAEEVAKLDRELKDVDASVGQFQRNVGNYPEAADEAADATDDLGKSWKEAAGDALAFAAGAVAAKASLDGIQSSLESNAEGSEAVREATSALGGAWDQVSNVVASTALDIVDVSKGLFDGSISAGDFAKSAGLAAIGLGNLDDSATSFDKTFTRTTEATTDFTDKVKASAEAQLELEKRIIAFEKASRPLEVRLTSLNGLIEQQQIIAGDSTRSFNAISEAILTGQELQVERAGIVVNLAKEELSIAQERIRIAELSNSVTVDLLDQETEAINKVKDAENGLKNEILENEKEIRQVKQDRLEIDLDILIDGFDNQKTINERIIANEKETLARRAALLDQTAKLAEDSFRGQKQVLSELSAAGINVDDLLLLDATELAKQIQLLEQSEIINTRTLEVIRERRIVLQDLKEAQEDLNEAEQEGIDLRKEIEAQEDALFDIVTSKGKATTEALEDLEEQRTQDQISSLERRLELVKEGSIEELRLRKELNDLLLQQSEKLAEEQTKKEEEAIKRRQELTEAGIAIISDLVDEGFEKRIDALGRQIEKTADRADQLNQKAQEGRLSSEESLAFEQRKEDELERQREKERKRQEKAQAFFTVLSTFQQNVNNNDPTPLQSTIRDVAVLRSLASTLGSAFDGVDDTGGRGEVDSKGGKLWVLHPNEQVYSKEDRKDLGFRSREEVKDIVKMYDKGMLNDIMKFDKSNEFMNPSAFVLNGFNDSRMVGELSEIKKGINNIDIPQGMVHIDEVKKLITLVTRKGNKVTKERSKLFDA